MPSWTSIEAYKKLLAACVAAHPQWSPKYAEIAAMYGENTTYDSIEGQFRSIKREAKKMREEVEKGIRPAIPPGRRSGRKETPSLTASTSSHSSASLEGVRDGRVAKRSSPKKKQVVGAAATMAGARVGGQYTQGVLPSQPGFATHPASIVRGFHESDGSSQSYSSNSREASHDDRLHFEESTLSMASYNDFLDPASFATSSAVTYDFSATFDEENYA